MNLHWSHALVQVHDLDTIVSFYCSVLGFEVSDVSLEKGKGIVFLSQDKNVEHHQLAFSNTSSSSTPTKREGHFAFRVAQLSDVKSLYQLLTGSNKNMSVAPICHGNTWSLYFEDPEGNNLEVFCDTPWYVDQPCAFSWDPSESDSNVHTSTLNKIEGMKGFGSNPRRDLKER